MLTVEAVAEAGKLMSQKDVAAMAHVTEEAVSRWNQNQRFKAAVGVAIKRGLQQTPWLLAELAAAARARRGSIRDWELYLQNGGPTSWRSPLETRPDADPLDGSTPSIGTQNNTVVQMVGIPVRDAFDTLPPAMQLLPAQPLASTSPAHK